MLGTIWNTLLVNPLLNALIGFYQLFGNFGIAIIALTVFIRAILIPVVKPSMEMMKKQKELQPQIMALRQKYKYDQQALGKKQMELFKEHGVNPASGCLNQIAMLVILIALYNVIRNFALTPDINIINEHLYFNFLKLASGEILSTKFLYLDLAKPDPLFIVALLSGVLQFIASKMMMPEVEKIEKQAEKTPGKTDDMAAMMQQQTLYMMPIMNVIIGVTLPSGVMLYIIATTIFTVVQNYFITGWGGLKPWINKLKSVI